MNIDPTPDTIDRRPRCTSDRMLHEAMAEASGISLEELQVRTDLSKVKLIGPGWQVVKMEARRNYQRDWMNRRRNEP